LGRERRTSGYPSEIKKSFKLIVAITKKLEPCFSVTFSLQSVEETLAMGEHPGYRGNLPLPVNQIHGRGRKEVL